MRRTIVFIFLIFISTWALGQDQSSVGSRMGSSNIDNGGFDRYNSEFDIGGRLHTDGWSIFIELEKQKNESIRNIFLFEAGETKHPKEDKRSRSSLGDGPWGPVFISQKPFVYGKQNIFYHLKFGFGQQRLIGSKGNKNGVEVSAIYLGGVTAGLLRPYYVEVIGDDGSSQFIKYSPDDKADFLNSNNIIGGSGLSRGWGEIDFNPGVFAHLGLRFDWAQFNKTVSAIEVGIKGSYYTKDIKIMVDNKAQKFFYGAYVSMLFGRRW